MTVRMRTGIEQLRQLSHCQRREQFSCCRGESMSSSCRTLGYDLGLGSESRSGGLLPTTSHSIFYSRVGQIATFCRCQPLDWEDTLRDQPFLPIPRLSSPCTVKLTHGVLDFCKVRLKPVKTFHALRSPQETMAYRTGSGQV